MNLFNKTIIHKKTLITIFALSNLIISSIGAMEQITIKEKTKKTGALTTKDKITVETLWNTIRTIKNPFTLVQQKFSKTLENPTYKNLIPAKISKKLFLQEFDKFKKTLNNELTNATWVDSKKVSLSKPEYFVQKRLLDKKTKVVFKTDIHGDICSFTTILKKWLEDGIINNKLEINDDHLIVISGDNIDSGNYGCEVLFTLMRLKNINKEKIVLTMGNHDEKNYLESWEKSKKSDDKISFAEELKRKYKLDESDINDIYATFRLFPSALYIGTTEDTASFGGCCHAGPDLSFSPKKLLDDTNTNIYQIISPDDVFPVDCVKMLCKKSTIKIKPTSNVKNKNNNKKGSSYTHKSLNNILNKTYEFITNPKMKNNVLKKLAIKNIEELTKEDIKKIGNQIKGNNNNITKLRDQIKTIYKKYKNFKEKDSDGNDVDYSNQYYAQNHKVNFITLNTSTVKKDLNKYTAYFNTKYNGYFYSDFDSVNYYRQEIGNLEAENNLLSEAIFYNFTSDLAKENPTINQEIIGRDFDSIYSWFTNLRFSTENNGFFIDKKSPACITINEKFADILFNIEPRVKFWLKGHQHDGDVYSGFKIITSVKQEKSTKKEKKKKSKRESKRESIQVPINGLYCFWHNVADFLIKPVTPPTLNFNLKEKCIFALCTSPFHAEAQRKTIITSTTHFKNNNLKDEKFDLINFDTYAILNFADNFEDWTLKLLNVEYKKERETEIDKKHLEEKNEEKNLSDSVCSIKSLEEEDKEEDNQEENNLSDSIYSIKSLEEEDKEEDNQEEE